MLSFISNNIGTIIVLAVLIAVVAAVTAKMIKDRKKGEHLCGGDCSKCHGCIHSDAQNKSE
ncbi:MAG: FeoB-associated Cys-rich membrane protein [Clostridiales bacterium]|nr:FeoB-associated Cys-rich membrane protein [Clostridiales bacterium]